MGKRITVESTLECDACFHFDFAKNIVRFCAQPVRFSYSVKGKRHTYVPDFLVQFDTEEYVLYEIKSDYAASLPDFCVEWEAKKQAAAQLGLSLELVVEKDIRSKSLINNLKLLHRYASGDCLSDTQELVLKTFKEGDRVLAKSLAVSIGFAKGGLITIQAKVGTTALLAEHFLSFMVSSLYLQKCSNENFLSTILLSEKPYLAH